MAEDLLLTKDRLLAATRRLSVAERIDIFLALRDELGDAAGTREEPADAGELSSEQLKELDRRLARHDADPAGSVPWEQVERELGAKYGLDP